MNNSRVYVVIVLFVLISPVWLWAVYINIDSIPWISYYELSLLIKSEGDEITYEFQPVFLITATNKELLLEVDGLIENLRWRKIFSLGDMVVQGFFGTNGYGYGGLLLVGPGLQINRSHAGSFPEFSEYHRLEIIDLREFCGGTPKTGICTYNNPFEGFSNLFIGLMSYTLICFILLLAIMIISRRQINRSNRNTPPDIVE